MVYNQLASFVKGVLFLLLLAGCTPHIQYRTSLDPCLTKPTETVCESATLEQHSSYLLSFVEFDDQGALWDRRQLTAAVHTLMSKEYLDSGAIILVFVHGWKHNADFQDSNAEEFRRMLRRVSKLEYLAGRREGRPPRKVAGVFVSWRGLSVPGEFFSNVSFWDRKNVANTVGHGAVTELLLQLENVQMAHLEADQGGRRTGLTRLVLIGHSFGGQIVFSALSQILLDRFIDLKGEPPQTFGDLVILVNPAFEATRFGPLRDASFQRGYPTGQHPLVTIFTATNDDATGVAFPVGRWLSTMFDKHRDSQQKSANHKAIGHFKPYMSHVLKREEMGKEMEKEPEKTATEEKGLSAAERERTDAASMQTDLAVVPAVANRWQDISSREGWSVEFDGVRLTHLGKTDPRNPFYVVSVEDDIIDGHNGIWKPEFANFLRRFILFSLAASE